MSGAIAQFMHAHPEIRIEMDLSDKRVDLVAEGFDLAIRIGVLSDSSLIAKKISWVKKIPCAAPDFLERYPKITRPEDLMDAPALVYSNDKSPADWGYTAPDGKSGVMRVNPKLTASNGDVLREAAIAGLGITCLPSFLHYDAINNGLCGQYCRTMTGRALMCLRYIPRQRSCRSEHAPLLISWHRAMGKIRSGIRFMPRLTCWQDTLIWS